MLYHKVTVLVTLGLFLSACEKDPEPLTTNSMIRGNVYWYTDIPDDGKARITAKGPYGNKSIEAVNMEDFSVDKLGNGTYCVDIEKEGYGTYERCDIQLFGNDTVHFNQVRLYPKPGDYKMPALARTYISYPDFYSPPIVPCITIETDSKDPDSPFQLMLFLKSGSDVAWNKYQYFASGWRTYFNSGKNLWIIYLSLENQGLNYLQSGDKVWIRAYACNENEPGYIDAYLGFTVFTTLDKSRYSNAIEFTLP
jgi:hypothetical protein